MYERQKKLNKIKIQRKSKMIGVIKYGEESGEGSFLNGFFGL